MTTSDFLGLHGCDWEGWPIKVKDMLLKQTIEQERARDREALEAFGGHPAPEEV